ncbi:MAG: CRISPR-associated endonuclease Cas2 [Sulfurovum sp.]|nr:CRISPR-associated endonuclease Cas2 [Sulfurovum sp.]
MLRQDFVICYDIADTKRLQKIAKYLEKYAFRIQKSVFFYPNASQENIIVLVDELNSLLDEEEDDIRIYHIDIKNSIALESGVDLDTFNIIK